MKRLVIFCVLFVLIGAYLFRQFSHIAIGAKPAANAPTDAPAGTWLTDFSAAKEQAARENKELLIDFTGSDWCGECQQLDAKVLNTYEFQQFAKNYVLVRLDFPHDHELSAALREQNDALRNQYGLEGFPTVIIATASGQEISRSEGYFGAAPAVYFASFQPRHH
ncbi:MAG TPA: thioredoxin family protein [Opitutaceae bacterium]|nr:thioredoxin family protein [Opitutaceae bacterium]